ncbi:MAG: TolC family protein [Sphingomonadales bacterium]|nr:TolC family protein [Sphingomonadales bacterium]MBD3775114.1 TolC family protein [Paracoccaceae bacterium]
MKLPIAILPALLVLSAPAFANEPGLPDEAAVAGALDDHPSVLAARARVDAAKAEARALGKGPHEFTVTGMAIQRSVDREGTFDEYDAQLMRGIRLPGKARLDREIGSYGVEAAENLAEDAKHQAALLLAGYWFDWLAAEAQARVDSAAVGNYERSVAATRRRMELRDAAQLEVDQAEAALGTARVLAEQSAGQAEVARARLQAHFPALALPAQAPELPAPVEDDAGLVALSEKISDNSHEIAAAQAEAQKRGAMAERARRDRTADPSVGVRLFSERSGAERGAGLVFTMPLGGGHRRALADQAGADASAAQADVQLARYNVREVASADLAEARYRIAAWKRARQALDAQVEALTKLRRGHQLGEIDLSDLLLGERMVHDAFRNEALARAEALRAVTRLRIDSHQLWLAD